MNAFDKNLKRLRKERNLKQEDLAQRLHVTRQTVSGWETGRRQPDLDTLKELVDHMAYMKLNSLQLYVEHVFEFVESKSLWESAGYFAGEELLLAAEGICLMAELSAKLVGYEINRVTDTAKWLKRYSEKWLGKNKASELRKIEELFNYYESL